MGIVAKLINKALFIRKVGMNGKIRKLSLICIAALLYSTLLTSFYHHHRFSYRSGCGFCKIVAEFCAADNAAPIRPVRPYLIPLYDCAEPPMRTAAPHRNGLIARAPPGFVV